MIGKETLTQLRSHFKRVVFQSIGQRGSSPSMLLLNNFIEDRQPIVFDECGFLRMRNDCEHEEGERQHENSN